MRGERLPLADATVADRVVEQLPRPLQPQAGDLQRHLRMDDR
jgi:hypothetical protein